MQKVGPPPFLEGGIIIYLIADLYMTDLDIWAVQQLWLCVCVGYKNSKMLVCVCVRRVGWQEEGVGIMGYM